MLEQPGRKTLEHNVVAIHERRHVNVDKQRWLLVVVDITAPRGAVLITTFQCFASRNASSQTCWFHLRQLHWECKYSSLMMVKSYHHVWQQALYIHYNIVHLDDYHLVLQSSLSFFPGSPQLDWLWINCLNSLSAEILKWNNPLVDLNQSDLVINK